MKGDLDAEKPTLEHLCQSKAGSDRPRQSGLHPQCLVLCKPIKRIIEIRFNIRQHSAAKQCLVKAQQDLAQFITHGGKLDA